jgi:sec-independent protein translocase protein TatA
MGIPGGWELVLIVGVVLLLFGGKKIPELAKGLGKGIKDFKKAVNEDDEPVVEAAKEIEAKAEETATAAAESTKA